MAVLSGQTFCHASLPRVAAAFWLMMCQHSFCALENTGQISSLHLGGKGGVCAVLDLVPMGNIGK